MTAEQYEAMTVEQKAAMLDEIQEEFINRDGKPFTMADIDAYYNLIFGYEAATKYDTPTFFIQILTKHLNAIRLNNIDKKNVLGFENTTLLIDAFAYFSEAHQRIHNRLHC